jgi:class 3 adenylate cyclase/pimeloyl-ACP methyl ester carboxylesterase
MGAPGDIHYARTSDGIDIAYTVFGEGPDLLIAPGFVSHMDLMWDLPPFEVMRGFGEHFRVIVFDKRGTGLSDRSLGFGSLEDRTEDIRAVLDAVGSCEAILYGISEGGPMTLYFTASHPERVRALVLYGTYACCDPSLPLPLMTELGAAPEYGDREEFVARMERGWGKGLAYQLFISHPPDPVAAQRVLARYERSACTPQMSGEIMQRNLEIDVTPVLAVIAVPTLVLHCNRDPVLRVEYGRSLASQITGAKYVEIDGDFHGSWRREDYEKLGPPVAAFLSEVLGQGASLAPSVAERELATVLFTDIVASTERAAEVGDAAWHTMLDQHEQSAAELIAAAGGRLVKTTGDGLLATFPGPSRAVATGRALQDTALALGVSLRAGLHTGEIERRGDDVGGIGVHIAARVAALAESGQILVTRTVRDLTVGSQLEFEERGTHTLKGVPDAWQLFAVR